MRSLQWPFLRSVQNSNMDDAAYIAWIEAGLLKKGKSKGGLAAALNIHQSQITRLLSGDRRLQAAEVPLVAKYLEEPSPDETLVHFSGHGRPGPQWGGLKEPDDKKPPPPSRLPVIRTLGEVAANVWRGVDSDDHARFDEDNSVFPPDPRYPVDAQYDLIVRGTSINRVAHDGYRLRVLDITKTGHEVPDGELVVVRRTRDDGQIVETTAKRNRRSARGYFDPRLKTEIADRSTRYGPKGHVCRKHSRQLRRCQNGATGCASAPISMRNIL